MKQITEVMKDRAFFVGGKDPWFRDQHDGGVEKSLANAEAFLDKVIESMGIPEVTGGTTADPQNVITLYWLVRGGDKITGVYVRFNINGTCDVIWDTPPIFTDRVERLSFRELLEFNVPAKLKQLRRGTGNIGERPSFDP